MSLYNLIKSLDLNDNLSKPELYSNIKLISDYVSDNLSTLNKPKLLSLIQGLKRYKQNFNSQTSTEFKFDDTIIKLDLEQQLIVQADPDLNMRVIAGAGSGKTTTILCRVKHILDNYTTPDRILILTFNRDSAQNIRNRVSSLFGFPIHLHIYTIDAFCYKLMNYYNYDSDVKLYSVSEYSHTGLGLMKKYGKEIASQYKYIFFDEFQDVNDVQFQILKIFTDNNCVLTVIGDDCQNIYQFRGTNNYYMINFDRIIDSQTYKLTTNYRSTSSIVKLANKSISFNELKVEKNMVAHDNSTEKPKFVMCETESDSIDYICKKVQEAINSGTLLHRIAILSRNSYPLKLMETEFTKRKIEHVACITDKNNEDIKKMLVPNKIAVTTIHKSKGLEWDLVIILGLSHEHWPEHLNNNIKNIEEERRLFYVGVTRARSKLYLIANQKEIPISVFINEVFELLSYTRYRNAIRYKSEELFGGSDDQVVLKESYGVTELITLLSPEDLNLLREENLIINSNPVVTKIIDSETLISFTEQIKANSYEPDVGEFCDRYVTRGIMCKFKLEFDDVDAEYILDSKELDEKQMEEHKKQKNKTYINTRRKYTYPNNILVSIAKAYLKLQDYNITNLSSLNEIYWISLCRNFRNDRNRLAYKNIFSLINSNLTKDFDGINLLERMDKIIDYLVLNKSTCKINVQHRFKIKNRTCSICGEIDLIDIVDENLIDLKCSEHEYRLEWMIQLLLYYSLLSKKDKKLIKKISIINIFSGKMYTLDLPEKYNCEKLIEILEKKIEFDQNSSRPKPSIKYESTDKQLINKKQAHIIYFNPNLKSNVSMVFDTETSDFNGDILQISWVLINQDNKIIETHDYFIKDRLTSKDSYQIHKISVEKLRKDGTDFNIVANKFIESLEKSDSVIGHNVLYDTRCVLKNFRKYDIIISDIKSGYENSNQIFDIFERKNIICTKKLSGGKSLDKLYLELYKENMIDAHNSLVDVKYTYKCYIKLIEKINLEIKSNNELI